MDPVPLDGLALSCADIEAIAAGRPVTLTAAGRERAAVSHRVGRSLAGRLPVYGQTTGVGANRSVTVPVARSGADDGGHVLRLLRSHATSAGELRPPDRVRALLAVRLHQLAAGGSGVDPTVLDGLAAMLAADALPAVREYGSVGTGDLCALATTALALAGESPTSRPLPFVVTFGSADGLGFLSSNAATLADAALAVVRLRKLADAALDVAAMSFTALRGNPQAVAEAVQRATPFPGAVAVARRLRRLLDGLEPGARIQDPFALRTLPQVFGPLVDALDRAEDVVRTMVSAPAENPLFLAPGADGIQATVVHHGAFQAIYLQQALDAVGGALARVAASGLARLGAMFDPGLTGLPAFLADGPAGSSGLMGCEYVAASALGQLRALALPAGLQSVSLSRGAEEDASFASLAAVQLLAAAGPWQVVLSAELLAATRAVRMSDRRPPPAIADRMRRCAGLGAPGDDRDLTAELQLGQTVLDTWVSDRFETGHSDD